MTRSSCWPNPSRFCLRRRSVFGLAIAQIRYAEA